MITIEQALAATPEGFKLVSFDGPDEYTAYRDRNGNSVLRMWNTVHAGYNGKRSPAFKTIEEATVWIESEKRWWKGK